MEIYALKINGMVNPIGCLYEELVCSWKVRMAKGKAQKAAKIEVSTEEDFSTLIYEIEGSELDSVAQPLDIKLQPYTRYYYRVSVVSDADEVATSQPCYFETAKGNDPWVGTWIGLQPEEKVHPVFSKFFDCRKKVEQARLYICGLGLFEAYVNGKKSGNDFLAPFLNDYYEHVQYCTYDITSSLEENNEIEVYLGNGWYKGRFGVTGRSGFFGKEFALIAEIRVTYADGSVEVLGTDETWRYRGSIFEVTDIYDGEVQNHLRWETAENSWRQAVEMDAPVKLVERYSLPVHAMESLPVKELIHTPAGEIVLDFGQNFAGYVECTQLIPRGTTMKLECAEVLQNGNFYHDNYKQAASEFVYVSDGTERLIHPHFTFFGFRYIKVTGLDNVDPVCFLGRPVYSDVERVGFIETSHPKLNRLYENSVWGLKSNYLDMPTDCPQRDERLGWCGDVLSPSGTASYHMDTQAFLQKFLRDVYTDQQRNGGMVAYYMPNTTPGITSSPGADVASWLPDILYTYYGNKEALRRNYSMAKDWVEYVRRKDAARGTQNLYNFEYHLGDWLALDGVTEQSVYGRTEEDYISSMCYYGSAKMVAKAAEILGVTEDIEIYAQLAEDIKGAILNEYFTPSGRLAIDTQTGYFMSLLMHVYRDKEKVVKGLKRRLLRDCYRIKSGLGFAAWLAPALAECGMIDEVYDFLFFEGFPSWLYAVNLGATTSWERWNSLLPDGTVSGTSMNSMNHVALSSIVEFLYRYTAGIQATKPGFREVRLEPKPNWRLRHFNCSYDSASGQYVSKWRFNEDETITVEIKIPFGAKATVILPDSGKEEFCLEAGEYTYTYKPLRDYTRPFNEHTRIETFAEYPEGRKILKTWLPRKYDALATENLEELTCSLADELEKNQLVGYTPEQLDKIERAMADMLCFPESQIRQAIEEVKNIKVF